MVKCFLKIEIFWGHEVSKLYFKCSKNWISWNIRAPKAPVFNEALKFFVKTFDTWFLKQSIFEASEAPKQWEGTISKRRRSFCWFLYNFELEATWISLIHWPHKMSSIYRWLSLLHLFDIVFFVKNKNLIS